MLDDLVYFDIVSIESNWYWTGFSRADQFVLFTHLIPMCLKFSPKWYKQPSLVYLGLIKLARTNRTPDTGLLHSEPLLAYMAGALNSPDLLTMADQQSCLLPPKLLPCWLATIESNPEWHHQRAIDLRYNDDIRDPMLPWIVGEKTARWIFLWVCSLV